MYFSKSKQYGVSVDYASQGCFDMADEEFNLLVCWFFHSFPKNHSPGVNYRIEAFFFKYCADELFKAVQQVVNNMDFCSITTKTSLESLHYFLM